MKRAGLFTKVMLAAIAAGLWALILRPVLWPGAVRAAQENVPGAKVVQAERFELVDSDGKVRATLGFTVEGREGGPTLNLSDEDGKARAVLVLTPGGSPSLGLFDGQRGAVLYVQRHTGPGLSLYDKEGKILAEMGIDEDGNPRMDLSDKGRRRRASLWLDRAGSPGLALHDKDGKVIWEAP